MDRAELAGAADAMLRRAALDGFGPAPMLELAEHVLGSGCISRVGSSALPRGATAVLARVRDRWGIWMRRRLDGATERFSIAHELAHHALGHACNRTDQMEHEADYFAACLVVPSRALRAAIGDVGEDLEVLAEMFQASQTCVALRLGELGRHSAVAVVTPQIIYARSIEEWVWPSEIEMRRLARSGGPGIATIRLTDARKRTALLAAA